MDIITASADGDPGITFVTTTNGSPCGIIWSDFELSAAIAVDASACKVVVGVVAAVLDDECN